MVAPLVRLIPPAIEKLWFWLGFGTTATVATMAAVENMNEANKAAGSSQSGTTSYTDACSSCLPPPDCSQKASEIEKTRNELKKRDSEMYEDQHDLFRQYYSESTPHPKYGSWEGHIRQFQQKQKRLRRLLSEYETIGCSKNNIPSDAYRWSTYQPYLPKFKG